MSPSLCSNRSQDGDILFIDTSHTIKTGGDVPWIFHEILPRLAPGVLVHVHDIFLPREYPQLWVDDGWGWNEQYLVHSFLLFNNAFDIVFGARWMLRASSRRAGPSLPRLSRT